MARAGDAWKQVSLIATEEAVPRKFLEAIMSDLRRAGLVEGLRGKYGGYRLARPPVQITFGEIMRVTDGPSALVPCASLTAYRRCVDCAGEQTCQLRRVLAQVRNEVSQVLDRTTLADATAE